MALLGKIVETVAKKAIIKTVGSVATQAAISTIDALGRNRIIDIPNINVPFSSESCRGRNFEEVKDELVAHGFMDISLLPKKDLINGWLTKDGSIEKITINGRDNFKKKSAFSEHAKVVIVYHTFKDKRLFMSTKRGFPYE